MSLPPQERAELAEHLLASLHQDGPDRSLDPSWLDELDARLQRYRRGETVSTDWEVVEKRLLARREARRKESA